MNRKTILILALLPGLYTGIRAQSNQTYDINDPRNPDCPCHKHQKLADEEYRKLLAQAEKKNAISEKTSGDVLSESDNVHSGSGGAGNNQQLQNSDEIKKKMHHKKIRHKRKRKHNKHPRWIRALDVTSWGIWKEFSDISACYRWK